MSPFCHILYYKVRSVLKIKRPITPRILFRGLGVAIVYLAFAVGTYFFILATLHYVLTQTKIGLFLLHEFISMILFVFFVTVNIGNIIVAYATLYKSEEVTFLLAHPIRPTQVFLIKFLDNFFYSSFNFIVILLAGILAYAHYFHLGFATTLALLFFNFLPFTFSAGMVGVLLLMLILRLALRTGLKPVIVGIAAFYSLSVISYFRGLSPMRLVNAVLSHYPDVNRYFSELLPPLIKLLPNQWLASSLFWLIKDAHQRVILTALPQITLCLGLFLLTIFAGYRFYYSTWLALPSLKLPSPRNRGKSTLWFAKPSRLPPPVAALWKRDALLFIREPSQIGHFIIMCLLILIFLVSLNHLNINQARHSQLQTLIYLTVQAFNAFLIASLALRFIYPLISLEGSACWRIRSAPVTMRSILLWRVFPFFLFIWLISLLLSFYSNNRFAATLMQVSLVISSLLAVTLVSLNLGMGGYHANYSEKSPIRLSSSPGATLSFLVSLVYISLVLIWLFAPLKIYFTAPQPAGYFGTAIVKVALLSAAATIYYYRQAEKSLERDL